MPMSPETIAGQGEIELALRQRLVRIAIGLPSAAVPDDHRSAAIFALGNDAFPFEVIQRVVFGLDGQPFFAGDKARPAGDSPAFQYAIEFEAQIEMQPPRVMLLDDEFAAALAAALRGRLLGFGEVALAAVCLQPAHAF